MNASVLFDPADPALHVDPYSVYRRLQSEAPVYWCDLGFWVASRYNDIAELFRDRSFGQGEFIDNIRIFYGDDFDVMAQPAYRWLSKIFVMQDPPDHTRMRGLITKALSAKRVAAMEPRIAEICARLLGDLAGRDEVDFVHEFAYKLPTLVMCDMLGLTAEEYSDEMLTELNQAIADSFLVFETRALEPDELDRANRQIELLNEYFGELFERRRKQPREDLATALVSSREGRDQLTHEELVTSTIGMFGAGFETTAHMIGNGLLAPASAPGPVARARPGAVARRERHRGDTTLRFLAAGHLSDGAEGQPGGRPTGRRRPAGPSAARSGQSGSGCLHGAGTLRYPAIGREDPGFRRRYPLLHRCCACTPRGQGHLRAAGDEDAGYGGGHRKPSLAGRFPVPWFIGAAGADRRVGQATPRLPSAQSPCGS